MGSDSNILKATHTGILVIGDKGIPCAVLEDGTRVLTEHGITTALGSRSGAAKRLKRAESAGRAPLPVFVASKNLMPFISSELLVGLTQPLKFKVGKVTPNGFPATLLPKICEVWLSAREAGALNRQQEAKCREAEIIMRGLAHTGIIALVDEATGYQYDRDRQELQKILAAYISAELMPWTKMFPDEFYKELFRLRGWQYAPLSVKRPIYVGKLTNELIYEKLPDGVLDQLRHKNPVIPNTRRRKHKFFQFLTEDVGNPHLQKQLVAVITLMKVSPGWKEFARLFARAFPEPNQPQDLPFPEESESDQ